MIKKLVLKVRFPSGPPWIKAQPFGWAFIVYRKPLARRVVQKKTNVDNGKRKTPFAILGVRSANCTSKQREVIQK